MSFRTVDILFLIHYSIDSKTRGGLKMVLRTKIILAASIAIAVVVTVIAFGTTNFEKGFLRKGREQGWTDCQSYIAYLHVLRSGGVRGPDSGSNDKERAAIRGIYARAAEACAANPQ